MKIAPIKILLPFVLAITAPRSVSGQNLFDFFGDLVGGMFGEDPKDSAKPEKVDTKKQSAAATEYVEQSMRENLIVGPVMNRLGDYVSGEASTEIAQGQRAYNCINAINTNSGNSRKQFVFADGIMESISYGIVYQLFDNDDDIDVICPKDPSERRSLALGSDGNKSNLRRRNQEESIGAKPAYPFLDADNVYSGFLFKNAHVTSYLGSADLNNRTAIGVLVDQLNSEIAVYQSTSENLILASDWITAIGDFISTLIPEGGVAVAGIQLDIGSTLRGIAGLLTTLSTSTEMNISRRQRTLRKIENHRSLIDSAEIEAGYRNTQALLAEMVSLRQKVEELERRARA